MKTYFLSAKPCALTVNGVYFGICDCFERFADVCLSDNLFLQFQAENMQPVGFFLTEQIRFTAPEGVSVYLLKNAIAIYVDGFKPIDCSLRPVKQVTLQDAVITLFFQGELHLSLQTPKGLFIATLPPAFADCVIEYVNGFTILSTEKQTAVLNDSAEIILLENTKSCKIENGKLHLEIALLDSLSRFADGVWDLSNGFIREKFTLRQRYTKDGDCSPENLQKELLPYAFFESVLIGAEYTQFLSEDLQRDSQKLRAFLGEYVAVTLTDSPFRCGLVKPKSARIFEVEYFETRIENGKICDIVTA